MEIIKASAASSVTVSFVSHCDIFHEKTEGGLGVWLEDEAQKGFAVSGLVKRVISMQLYSHYTVCW